MPRLACALFALVMAAGCGGKGSCPTAPAAPVASTDPVAVKVAAYEESMCACKTAACAEALSADVEAWTNEHGNELKAAFADPLRSAQLEPHIDHATSCKSALAGGDPGLAGDGPDDGPGYTAEVAIAKMGRMADDLCACKDMACAEQVMKKMSSMKEPAGKPTRAEMEKAMKIAEKMAECQKKLMTADVAEHADVDADDDGPPPPPDDRIRPPVAADLAGYLKGIKGLKAKGTLTATIDTNLGSFHCALYDKQAPMTVANFVGLASGQKPWRAANGDVVEGVPFYDGLRFHRVIPDFMIQGGDPKDDGRGGPGYAFANEIVDSLRHDAGGVLSMANAGPDTNGSQFFITAKATPFLDGKHTVFGRCKEVALVAKITALSGTGDRPTRPVVVTRVTFSRK